MDKQFTQKLQDWLNTPADKRDLEQGALFLLQLSNNKILYNNISRNVKAHAEFIEFKIKRYLQYRLQSLTHEQVDTMQKQVDQIVKRHALDKAPSTPQTKGEEWRGGKRADHDSLPAEIQALYVENASLLQKMRELHLQLRNLSTANATCPDSDRYPFLVELIKLDKQYHQNWLTYDKYEMNSETQPSVSQQTLDESEQLEQKNILRRLNMTKGRFKKAPTDALKEQILSLYQQLTAPSESLTSVIGSAACVTKVEQELKELGIL